MGRAVEERWYPERDQAGQGYQSGLNSSLPGSFKAVGNILFFSASAGGFGRELWRSDGTESGTFLVKDIRPGASGSFPLELTDVRGTLFFKANDGTHGIELWKSNGTAASTVMVKDIFPGVSGSDPNQFKILGDDMYFVADDGVHGRELWSLSLLNDAPTVAAGGPYSGLEGTPVQVVGTFIDDDIPQVVEWSASSPLCSFTDPSPADHPGLLRSGWQLYTHLKCVGLVGCFRHGPSLPIAHQCSSSDPEPYPQPAAG
jgi:ELWxxDGT repeat protein